MLTYTFTTREKFLLAFFVILVGGLAWYYFIFSAVQLRVDALESQIATAQDQIAIASTQVSELQSMRAEIERYEAEGRTAVQMPPYDNTSAVMAQLNATIGVGEFTLNADNELDTETAGIVKHGWTLEFQAQSYEGAREILDSIAEGEFPCSIESVSIEDESLSRNSTEADHFAVKAHITFYEDDVLGLFTTTATDANTTTDAS